MLKEYRQYCIMKFLKELETKLKRDKDDLLLRGLICTDFSDKVSFELDDGTKMEIPRSLSVENEFEIGVFTEHYGYFVIEKDSIFSFKEVVSN